MQNKEWNSKFGNNFTDNGKGLYEDMKSFSDFTDGQYQADISGGYGEFTLSSVFKSLGNDFHLMDNILIQTGIQYKRYMPEKYGQSQWEVVQKNGKLYEKIVKSSQIDHVLVCPYGVFVIETKNHKGRIFGDENGQVWTQIAHNGKCGLTGKEGHFTFFNPVRQNRLHVQHLIKGIGLKHNYVMGVICFTNPEVDLSNVRCGCCFRLDQLYYLIKNGAFRICLNVNQIEKIVKRIDNLGSSSYLKDAEHVKYVRDIQRKHEINRRNRV